MSTHVHSCQITPAIGKVGYPAEPITSLSLGWNDEQSLYWSHVRGLAEGSITGFTFAINGPEKSGGPIGIGKFRGSILDVLQIRGKGIGFGPGGLPS